MKHITVSSVLGAILLVVVLSPADIIDAVTDSNRAAAESGSSTCCPGNVNCTGIVDLSDLSALVSYLTGGGYVLPECPQNTVTDIDGNEYRTVTIGTQVWMAENLKVTHYRNGEPIPYVTDNTAWLGLTTGAYCEYNNNVHDVATYGRLYNWFVVGDSRNIAPAGWHVPTVDEWQTLVDFLGGQVVAGGKMKEAGTTHWISPNTGATNESGFSALPSGFRSPITGGYEALGLDINLWSATEAGTDDAWYRSMDYDHAQLNKTPRTKIYGFSIRCVKD